MRLTSSFTWPFLEISGPQKWVVGATLALKQKVLCTWNVFTVVSSTSWLTNVLFANFFSLSCRVSSLTVFAQLVAKRRRYVHAYGTFLYRGWENKFCLFCSRFITFTFDLFGLYSCLSFAMAKRIEFLSLMQKCLSSKKNPYTVAMRSKKKWLY